jgi:recombination protein RecA
MSSSLVCAQPATGHPGAFVLKEGPALLRKQAGADECVRPYVGMAIEERQVVDVGKNRVGPDALLRVLSAVPRLCSVTAASRLEVRPTPEMVSSGIAAIDALTGGLPRGCLTEICGPASSGRSSVLLAALATATQRDEVCALVDTTDAFDPFSAAAAGVNFERLLWVRCGARGHEKEHPPRRRGESEKNAKEQDAERRRIEDPLEQALRVTDLLLRSGGFGLVAIDLGNVPFQSARRIPLTSWFRFQRAVENTPTVLFVIAETSCAQTCASLVLRMQASVVGRQSSGEKLSAVSSQRSEKTLPAHAQVFDGFQVEGELMRSRLERKPARSVTTAFATKAVG